MGQIRWIGRQSTLGASPATDWFSTDCPECTLRARLLDDGHIEVEGLGIPTLGMPQAVGQWAPIVIKYASQYGVPAQIVAGIISGESGGKQRACNPEGGQRKTCDDAYDYRIDPKTGAQVTVNKGVGLMQITDPGLKAGHTNTELLDNPDLNVQIGTEFFGKLWRRYQGNLVKAIVSYNHGSNACWTSSTASKYKQNPWGAVMTADYISTIIRYTNGCVDSGLFLGNASPTCPEGYQPDSAGNCVPIPIAQNCPQGYQFDASGNCVPVKSPVSTASASSDSTPLIFLLGAAALAYLAFSKKTP